MAGALKSEGWPEADAVDFLAAVCRAAGDEDRPKREATIRHTWAKTGPLTGWTTLRSLVDPVVVDAARTALGPDAEWKERADRRVEAATPTGTIDDFINGLKTPKPPATPEDNATWGVIDWYQVDPAVKWIVEGVIQEGTVNLGFGAPNSLKTWAFYLLAACVAKGDNWLGRKTLQGLVVILDYESSQRQARRRMKLLQKLMDKDKELNGNLRYINPEADARRLRPMGAHRDAESRSHHCGQFEPWCDR